MSPFFKSIFELLTGKKCLWVRVIFLAILMVPMISIQAQQNSKQNIDFLSQDSYETLSNAYQDAAPNLSLMLSFAQAYLLKAKREGNSLEQAKGFYIMGKVHTAKIQYDIAKKYLDSCIHLTKDKPSYNQPARAYILRADINGAQTNFSSAMDDLGKANTYANSNGNIEQQYEIKYFISILKSGVGDRDEAISLLKEVIAFYDLGNTDNAVVERYRFYSLFALGAEYNAAREPDSALIHLKKVIQISLKEKDSLRYERFLRAAGFSYYLLGEYHRALDSILKSQKVAHTKENLAVSTPMSIHTSLGLIYDKLNDRERAHFHLKKMDSIAFAENYFYAGIQEPYKLLVEYAKKEGNTEKQLDYINRLLYADSVANYNKQYVSHMVNEDYDIPNLIQEKEILIRELNSKNKSGSYISLSLGILVLCLASMAFWYYNKQHRYKIRFNELLTNSTFTTSENLVPNIGTVKQKDVPVAVVTMILEKLAVFESEKEFLEMNINLSKLAKKMDSNTKYLSKTINSHKGKSFTNYITDLRIGHAIEELQQNAKLRKFTIKAIAQEMGFNTTEAFSKSFFKKTGIYPSFYIKQLEKKSA